MDTLNLRQRILLNQPHIESVSGDIASFTTDMKAPLKECKVSFMPVQEGEGDPSLTNVRNITGWNGVSVKNGENTYSMDWTDSVGTVYGGYIDLVKGELVAEWYSISTTAWKQFKQNNGYKAYKALNQPNHAFGIPILCNMVSKYASFNSNNMNGNVIQPHNTVTGATGTIYLALDENIDISNIQVVWKLIEPVHHQLTPQQLLTLKGTNNIWSNSNGQTEVKFWTH